MKPLLSNTPQALYWMGFLIADGYFCFHNHRIELNLSHKDENHLQAFMSFCNNFSSFFSFSAKIITEIMF